MYSVDESVEELFAQNGASFSAFAKTIGAEIHDKVTIGKSKVGGIGIFFETEGFTASKAELDSELVQLIKVPRTSTLNLRQLSSAFKREASRSDKFFKAHQAEIKKLEAHLGDAILPFKEIRPELSIIEFIMDEFKTGAVQLSESLMTKAFLIGLVMCKRYRGHVTAAISKNTSPQGVLLAHFYGKLDFVLFDQYLELLEHLPIPTLHTNGLQKKDAGSVIETLLNHYQVNNPIGAALEYVMARRKGDYQRLSEKTSDTLCLDDFLLRAASGVAKQEEDKKQIACFLLPLELYEQFEAALNSRVLELPRSLTTSEMGRGNSNETYTTDISLVPLIDFANHSNAKHVKNAHFDADKETEDAVLYLDYNKDEIAKQVKATGSSKIEIFISYHPEDDIPLFITSFGFLPVHKGCRQSDSNAWEVSLATTSDAQLDDPDDFFHSLCTVFQISPSFQVVYDFDDTEETHIPDVSAKKIVLASKTSFDLNEFDDFLTLFHPNMLALHYDAESFHHYYAQLGLSHLDLNSDMVHRYHRARIQEHFYIVHPKTHETMFPQDLEELRSVLSELDGQPFDRDLCLKNFKKHLEKFIFLRLKEIQSLKEKLNVEKSSLVAQTLDLESKILASTETLIHNDSTNDIFKIDPN